VVNDEIIRAARDYVRGRHSPNWAALLTRLRDASESAEHKAFADEVLACLAKHPNNPAKARASVRDLLKRNGIAVLNA
jgi:hypothetical protein